jgi:V/A-type H+/Na+-transporting ATPase subunit D
MPIPRVPPGRMGRLWLVRRLGLADRAVSLLEEKLRLLAAQREVLKRRADETRRTWHDACNNAESWGLRATLLAGQRALVLAAPTARALVTIEWATTIGVRYPDRAQCTLAPRDDAVTHTSAATVEACQAYSAALVAAAEHAAARSALDIVERELKATRLRARALNRHWLPRLRDELARIELQLEEQDRAEAIRVRLVDRGLR